MDWILLGIPVGAVMLYLGSEWMVRGAKGLALRLGVPPLVVGLTVVALGTSSPECVTSIVSGDTPQIIIGNIVGSNIANAGLALGLTAVAGTVAADYMALRPEVLTFMLSLAVMFAMSLDGTVGLADGIVLLLLLTVFIAAVYVYRSRHTEGSEVYTEDVSDDGRMSMPLLSVMLAAGVLFLYSGASLFIDGAEDLASVIGVSDMVIGLIVVALGASLPETCISIVAALRGENDIALANILGSVIFNSFFALGVGAVLTDIPISGSMIGFHMPFMLLSGAVMFVMIRFRDRISRPMGLILVSVYAAYLLMMYLDPALTV